MKLLLDTHVVIWGLSDATRLPGPVREAITDVSNTVMLSAVTVWEVSIKAGTGKLRTASGWPRRLLDAGAVPLPVTLDHAEAVAGLPLHHRDPFDRMLVAQAMTEGAAIVSRDEALRAYGVEVIW